MNDILKKKSYNFITKRENCNQENVHFKKHIFTFHGDADDKD